MKTTITISVGMLIVGVMSVLVTQRDSIEEFFANTAEVQVEKEIVVETIEVNTLEDRIKSAQDAEMGRIEASAQEAYDVYIQGELKKIEDKVKTEYIIEIEETISDAAY